jgi:hypothetical protein
MLGDVRVREPHHAKAAGSERLIAPVITEPASVIHLAAELHHKPRRQAREINDVRSDQSLAAKLETIELFAPQARPQIPLDTAHRAAQVTGELDSRERHCTQQHRKERRKEKPRLLRPG